MATAKYGLVVEVEDAWKALGQVNDWIRFADAKAAAVLVSSGVLGGLLIKGIPRLADLKTHPVRAVMLALSIACLGCAAFITLRTLAPRLRTGEPRSLLYFDHIARRYAQDRNGFVDGLFDLGKSNERFARQIADQIWANSLVARRKFRRSSIAIYFLGAAMALAGGSVFVERLLGW